MASKYKIVKVFTQYIDNDSDCTTIFVKTISTLYCFNMYCTQRYFYRNKVITIEAWKVDIPENEEEFINSCIVRGSENLISINCRIKQQNIFNELCRYLQGYLNKKEFIDVFVEVEKNEKELSALDIDDFNEFLNNVS